MKVKALLAAFGILMFAGSAFACHIVDLTMNADCNGWTASGSITVCGTRDTMVYTVNLKQGDAILATFSETFVVWSDNPTFSFDVPWGMELCGDYVAEGHFGYINLVNGADYRDFSIPFTCECEEEGGCHYTPGYWKNHPEDWPVTNLTLGCVNYDQAALLVILGKPVRGDATIILAHHLIAAMLNVANGADDAIQSDIDAGNSLLCRYPLYSNPADPARAEIIDVKNALCAYNEYVVPGCEEECIGPVGARLSADQPAQTTSWGAVKGLYR